MESSYDTYKEESSDSKIPVKRKKIRRPGLCKICGKTFKDQKAVYIHKRIHTGEKPYICEICGKRFNQNSNLKRHLDYHKGVKRFHCEICNKDFANRSKPYFQQHVLSHSGEKPFTCELCDRSYSLKSSYDTHMRAHAKNPSKKNFVCDICHAEFDFKCWLEKHVLIHDPYKKVYMCDLCKRVFRTPFARNTHLKKKHDILTAYECKICHKRYKNHMTLRMHQKTHGENTSSLTGTTKKSACSSPKQRNSNISHGRKNQNKDINNNAKTKTKQIATISTSASYIHKVVNPSQLQFILSFGTESRRFICAVCQHTFSSLVEINEHLKTHNQSVSQIHYKPVVAAPTLGTHVKTLVTPEQTKDLISHNPVNHRYLCAVCQKDFHSATEIKEHLSTHTNGGNLFICGLCKESFPSADVLKHHIDNTHIIYTH